MHVFIEKPLCVDVEGYKSVMESNRLADQKNLKVTVGLQRRYEPGYWNLMDEIAEGRIGDVSYSRVYWNGGGIWNNQRSPNQTELQWQMHNWYHFQWLCGDNICEQHVHNIDIGLWAHGKGDPMFHPVEANAQGGRQVSAGPLELLHNAPPFSDREEWFRWYNANRGAIGRFGTAWDHFFVEFTMPDGSRMFSQCRHIPGCWDTVTEYIHGTNGYGRNGRLFNKAGTEIWRNTESAINSYQLEHNMLVQAIREDLPRMDGWYSAQATMACILGRTAAFSGQRITWDDCINRSRPTIPIGELMDWDMDAPTMPDENGFYESSVPRAGRYRWHA
jgi:predicted dehydrogenase